VLTFGPFRLDPIQRVLEEGDRPVRLGSRSLEILLVLVERAGELVGTDTPSRRGGQFSWCGPLQADLPLLSLAAPPWTPPQRRQLRLASSTSKFSKGVC
jgi:hypothetical protein